MNELRREAVGKLLITVGVMVAILFGCAGTLGYLEGWVFLAVFFVSCTLVTLMVRWVFRANTFAFAVIEVDPGQRVISTGPYARVRQPMYLSAMVLSWERLWRWGRGGES